MPCSGFFLECALVGAATLDLAVLRLMFFVAVDLVTFVVGVFLAFFAFAFRPESISTKPFSSAATPSGYGRQL